MSYRIIEDGHVSSPKGYRATGVSSGLKEVRARDLALIYSTEPARAAAMFTTSSILAAPIFFNQAVLARNSENIRAVLINAGHANAGTGQPGLLDAIECAKLTADELEVPRDSVLLMSTGKIGVPLPMDKMRPGIRRAVSELDSGGGRRAALAVMTTDTRPKERALSISLKNGQVISIGGLAKGGRMTAPSLATMLAVLTTDLAMDARLLKRSLEQSVAKSFARLALDGGASPNDGVILLANGAAGVEPIADLTSWEYGAWQEALDAICADLAQQIVRDASGSGKCVRVHVRGAADDAMANQVAQTVARSPAVRAACAHGVADWGALLIAIGASHVDLRADLLELRFGSMPVMIEGMPVPVDPLSAVQVLAGNEIDLTIDMHLGTHSATVWTYAASGT
jgi:glutamate N-acetyltransferase/amino-acid N-acetyltransferase